MSVTIFDLDNCISDDEWRVSRILDDESAPDSFTRYHNYHSLSAFDTLANRPIIEKVKGKIVIVTTRPNFYRAMTEEWLGRNRVPFWGLVMRSIDDERPAHEIKREQAMSIQAAWKESNGGASIPIACAYDDDKNVIAAYESEGIRAKRLFIRERPEAIANTPEARVA